jgi:hypothetical protein
VIGKESNSYDEVEAGAVSDWDAVQNVYGRACERCAKPLINHHARYCGNPCRQASYRVRVEQRRNEGAPYKRQRVR